MRVPLVLLAIPIFVVGVFGIFISPAAAMRYIEQTAWLAPMKVRLAAIVPMIAGNRSLGAVAISCVLLLVLKQMGDYFDKPLDK
jgi:uncharacterized protein YqgC (DUF456 family)